MKDRLCTTPMLAYHKFNFSFIMTTEASRAATGVILSQVQGGVERPTAYVSRQTKAAEQP